MNSKIKDTVDHNHEAELEYKELCRKKYEQEQSFKDEKSEIEHKINMLNLI
jgi:hypothetical protein